VAFIMYGDQPFLADSKLLPVPYLIRAPSMLAMIVCWHYTVGPRRR
jgi:hypothetical protein